MRVFKSLGLFILYILILGCVIFAKVLRQSPFAQSSSVISDSKKLTEGISEIDMYSPQRSSFAQSLLLVFDTEALVQDIQKPIEPIYLSQQDNTSLPKKPVIKSEPILKWLSLSHINGPGIGYEVGYTKLSAIVAPTYRMDRVLPLLDVRGMAFNDGTYAANVGLIGRIFPSSLCAVFGVNAYYDMRQGKLGNYHQLGLGLELLGSRWDARANGYIPVGRSKHSRRCVFNDHIDSFKSSRTRSEIEMSFFDANVGYYLMDTKQFNLYLSAGPYYFQGLCNRETWGGKVVLRPRYKEYFAVELSLSYDPVFSTIFQVNVVLSLPLYKLSADSKSPKRGCRIRSAQMYQPVIRNEIIPLDESCNWRFNW